MEDPDPNESADYLTGNLLLAMPQMQDERFIRSVVYICAHTSDGAMGLVINKIVDLISKQFKLYDIMKYVKEPNDADKRIDALEQTVFQQGRLIEMLLLNEKKEK